MKVILVFPLLFVAKLLMTFGPVEAMNVNNQPRNEITKTSSSKKLHSGSSSVAKPHVASGLAPSTSCSSSASENVNAGSNVPITLEDGTLLTGIEDIIYGIDVTVILRKDGTVWGLRNNDHGQLGVGSIAELFATPIQTEEGALRDVTGIWSDGITIFAERTDGTIWKSSDEASNGCFNDKDDHLSILKSKNKNSFLAENHCKLQEDRCRMLFSPNDSSLPEEWLLKYFGYTEVDPMTLAPNGSGLTIFQCYLQGIDPKQAEPEEPFAISISATGPYRAPANIEFVTNIRHPANTSILKVECYSNGKCVGINTTPPYKFTLNGVSPNTYRIEARAYDSTGKIATATTEFEVVPSNYYNRGQGEVRHYYSSMIAIDSQKGIFLDKPDLNQPVDFRIFFPENKYPNYPWFLRTASDLNEPCYHIINNNNQLNYLPVNNIPTINGTPVGGQPPMVAFGSQGGGSPLYAKQTYHFGIAAGGQRPEAFNNPDIKIEVYDKESFVSGANNVDPIYTQTYTLPRPENKLEWDSFSAQGFLKDYHLVQAISSGKMIDFDTQIQYVSGMPEIKKWGQNASYPLFLTHKAANSSFYYKVSIMGALCAEVNSPIFTDLAKNSQGSEQAYNISYTLDFEESSPWQAVWINQSNFQGIPLPSCNQEKSVDELIHQALPVNDTLTAPEAMGLDLKKVNNSPELKSHFELNKLVASMGNDPMALANYVLNEIELVDAIGINTTPESNNHSINPQGISRDALATYLEGQGSPIEQCALLIYLLRQAGYPSAYVFPEHDGTLMIDQQLSKLLQVQLRGALTYRINAGFPELIPVNYPWVATYIHGKWIHLFPWLKNTEITEGKDLLDYFPEGYQTIDQWVKHYLLNDPTIRGLSKEDNVKTLFPLYAEQQLKKAGLSLSDVGMKIVNRRHYYADWNDFPRPWKTPIISNDNIASNLDSDQNPKLAKILTNIFDTISIRVFSDRDRNRIYRFGEPMIETGPMRLVDLHDRRLLLYHKPIEGTSPTEFQMILSLEPYDATPGSSNTETYTFNKGDHPVPKSDLFRSQQKISTQLQGNNDDAMLCYNMTYARHQQAIDVSKGLDYYVQLPGLIEATEIDDVLPLEKGDMACLSLCYGRTTKKMQDFQYEKYKAYQQAMASDPNASGDIELAAGQLLEMLGQSYYAKTSEFQQFIEPLTKTHAISWIAHGLSKFSPERHPDGSPVVTTNNGKVDLELAYPIVDMSFLRAVGMSNNSYYLNSGDTTLRADHVMELMCMECSANEHRVINEFFHQDNAISTIKLLDIAQGWTPETQKAPHPGEGVILLTANNYRDQGSKSYSLKTGLGDITHSLKEWATCSGIWSDIEKSFSSSEGALTTIIITPSPVQAPGQQGKAYTGMGGMLLEINANAAIISSKSATINGGWGGRMNTPISVEQNKITDSFKVSYGNSSSGFNPYDTPTLSPHEQEQLVNNLIPPPPVAPPLNPTPINLFPDHNPLFDPHIDLPTGPSQSIHPSPAPSTPSTPSQSNESPEVVAPIPTPPPVIPPLALPINAVETNPVAKASPIATPPPTLSNDDTIKDLQKILANKGFLGLPTYYGKQLHNFVMDPVSVVTGEFYINALDFKLNGPMPLEIRRIYSSKNQSESALGHGWRLNYVPYLMLSSDSEEIPSLISAAETDGSVVAYRYNPEQKNWLPTIADNPTLINEANEANGTPGINQNLFNNRITQTIVSGVVTYTLKGFDGSERRFKTRSFPTLDINPIDRKRPYLDTWKDNQGNSTTFNFGTNNKENDWGQLKSIISSNGNNFHFNYDCSSHLVEVFSNEGCFLRYEYDNFGDLTKVILPDASAITYSYEHKEATVEGDSKITYSTHLITEEKKPNGRLLQNSYDEQRRVVIQASTVGMSPTPTQSATFNYGTPTLHADGTLSGTTIIADVNGNKTSYSIDNSQIAKVIYPSQNNSGTTPIITQEWYSGTEGVPRALKSRTDQRGLITNYQYDAQGNLTTRTLSGNITGKGGNETATTTMTYNSQNLLSSITDSVGHGKTYAYEDASHPYNLTSITQTASGKTTCTTKLTYQDMGSSDIKACGLLVSSMTEGISANYTYDTHGFLMTITQQTGTHDPNVVTQYTTNSRGEITSETDMLSRKKKYTYDAMGRRIGEEIFDETGSLIAWHFTYYNENGDVTWQQGARYNPVDYTYYEYDRAGHVTHKTTWLSAATPDESGVTGAGMADTCYNYDAQGNLIEVIDPNHHSTKMTYDALGHMMTRSLGDGLAAESFTYELGGQVATHTTVLGGEEKNSYTSTGLLQSAMHADGTMSSYCYDLSGRLLQETLPNGSSWKTTYDDANRTVTRSFCGAIGVVVATESQTFDVRGNVIEQIDRAGNKFVTTYDGLNRIKSRKGPAASDMSAEQSILYVYRPEVETIVNGAGEVTNLFSDALGEPTLITTFNSDGTVANNTSYWYAADHQSFMTFQGKGSNLITSTTYTDHAGRPVIFKHADGSCQITTYDANGNKTSFRDENGGTTSWTYDALNHLTSETLLGGAVIGYNHNAAGELLTRNMPQGLVEKNDYDIAGHKISDALIGSDGAVTRNHTYNYTSGLLSSIVDPRGFTTSISYDAWQHPMSVISSGSSIPEQNQITRYTYDPRGLLTSVAQEYAANSNVTIQSSPPQEVNSERLYPNGPSTLVTRGYDAYGQLISEATSLNGTNVSSWTQHWNSAGHRINLNWQLDQQGKGAQYEFGYNALGLLTKAANVLETCTYSYADNGLLMQRKTPFATMNITERDNHGRVINEAMQRTSDGSTLMSEHMEWIEKDLLKSYNVLDNALGLPSEARTYVYDPSGRLQSEPYVMINSQNEKGLSNSQQKVVYLFDETPLYNGISQGNGLGVRTTQYITDYAMNRVASENSFGQVIVDNNKNNKPDGLGLIYPWTNTYDAEGEITCRALVNLVVQNLTWDSFGRLVNVAQNSTLNDEPTYNWKTVYDGLGRRIQTTCQGNLTGGQPVIVSYYYDPEVEFLEIGHDFNGRTWSLYGPDKSGTYGGAQGIGGLDGVFLENSQLSYGLVNNFFGDNLGFFTAEQILPYLSALGGYGPMPGSSVNSHLEPQWRGHYQDWTGFYYMGARYYDSMSGRFLSADPLGHEGSLSLYDYCGGDPINGLDPDGRCAEGGGPVDNQYLFSPNRAPIELQMNTAQSDYPFASSFMTCDVAIDYDGDPRAYAPPGSGLRGRDKLKNAINSKTKQLSHDIIAFGRNGEPLINGGGYYVSTTSLYHGYSNIQENNVNANKIPYIAFGGGQTGGARYGDFVFLQNNTTAIGTLAIYADYRGDDNNKGVEISEEAAKQLGVSFNRDGVISKQSVTATIYPGSRLAPFAKSIKRPLSYFINIFY